MEDTANKKPSKECKAQFESVNNFQTASLHGNKKQTILKVGGGTNGK